MILPITGEGLPPTAAEDSVTIHTEHTPLVIWDFALTVSAQNFNANSVSKIQPLWLLSIEFCGQNPRYQDFF